jgi:hypothetical protein
VEAPVVGLYVAYSVVGSPITENNNAKEVSLSLNFILLGLNKFLNLGFKWIT